MLLLLRLLEVGRRLSKEAEKRRNRGSGEAGRQGSIEAKKQKKQITEQESKKAGKRRRGEERKQRSWEGVR